MISILPGVVVSITSYFLSQILFVNCRLRIKPLISPLNWFLCLFFLQMVLVPFAVVLTGPSVVFLPFRPSNAAINAALLVNTVAYWSFCCAVQLLHEKSQTLTVVKKSDTSTQSWIPPIWVIVTYTIIGVTGIALRFGNVSTLVDYFTDPQSYLIGRQAGIGGSATFAEAASTFLMPFFPFSLILLWCRGAYWKQKKGILPLILPPVLIVLVVLSSSLYGYNRAGFVIPMIAVAAVMAKRRVASGHLRLLALGSFVAILLFIISSYRLLITPQGEAVARQFTTTDISDYFQDYGAAPQYLGFLLQSTNYMENPRLGQVLLSSALSPVPIIGKPFRQHSGNIIYGSLLGRGDQPVIFVGELLLDFSIFGVIGGFLTLGVCTSSMQNKYEISNEPFQTYAIQFASICFSYFIVCGIEEVSQLLLVFLWPVYFFLLYRIIKKKY